MTTLIAILAASTIFAIFAVEKWHIGLSTIEREEREE